MTTFLTTKRFGCFKLHVSDAQHAHVEQATEYVRVFGVDYDVSLHLTWQEGWSGKGDGTRQMQWTVNHMYMSRKGSYKEATPAAKSAIRAEILEAFVEMVTSHPELLADADLKSQLSQIESAAKRLEESRQELADAETALVDQIEAYAKTAKVNSKTLLKQYASFAS